MATKGWLRAGFLGCSGLVALVVLAAGVLFAVARVQIGGEKRADETLREETIGSVTRVRLDAMDAHVRVVPAEADAPLQLDAAYDARYFALEREVVPSDDGGQTWHIRFEPTASGPLMQTLRSVIGGVSPQVWLRIPRDTPLAVHATLTNGLTDVELGGLEITEAIFEQDKGDLDVLFSEPSPPMDRLAVDVRFAGFNLLQAGNASPRIVEVTSHVSAAQIDLRGEWRRDAEIVLETGMVGGNLRLPPAVRFEGLSGAPEIADGESLPTLRFRVAQGSRDGLQIVH